MALPFGVHQTPKIGGRAGVRPDPGGKNLSSPTKHNARPDPGGKNLSSPTPRNWALDELKDGILHPCSLELSWSEGEARALTCEDLAPSRRALDTIFSSGASGVKAALRLRDWRKQRANRIALSREYSPCLSRPGAELTLFAFLDYDCGFCKSVRFRLYDLVQGSPVRVCVKQFPTAIMERYPTAALATVAAHQQGSFLGMFNALYRRDGEVEEEDVIALARDMDLDVERFRADLDSDGVRAVLLRDVTEGGRVGVRGTPTLVAGDEVFTDFELLEEWVSGLLDKRRNRRDTGTRTGKGEHK
jgi:protein-disulfide isomerase